MSEILERLASFVRGVIETGGYPGLAFLTALENVFPPIPSELILPFAGFLVAQGRFSLLGVIVASTVGSVAGALLLYALGTRVGEEGVRDLVRRHGRLILVDESDLDRAEDWFDRHGGPAVFLGRFVPGVRSLISIPAGFRRMSLPRFLAFTAAGSAAWNGGLAALGWLVGDQWERIRQYAELFGYAVLGVLAVLVVRFAWRRSRNRRSSDDAADGARDEGEDGGERSAP